MAFGSKTMFQLLGPCEGKKELKKNYLRKTKMTATRVVDVNFPGEFPCHEKITIFKYFVNSVTVIVRITITSMTVLFFLIFVKKKFEFLIYIQYFCILRTYDVHFPTHLRFSNAHNYIGCLM